jgi:cation:H+ antiporter
MRNMLTICVVLVLMLIVILIGAEVFTNALEHLASSKGLSAGVTGSILAAIGTALPETIIPLMAIFAGSSNSVTNHEIGVGSILGAPLMLSTLSLFALSIAVISKRGFRGVINAERSGMQRDLNFFLVAFLLAGCAMYVPAHLFYLRVIFSVMLVGLYAFYVYSTFKASAQLVDDGHGVEVDKPMFFVKWGLKNNDKTTAIQCLTGLIILLIGAKGFIYEVAFASNALNISALIISLLIIPIATEFPEKMNSIMWMRRGKDTLAMGNITGAMVFQGTLLPAIGILFTPWLPAKPVIIGIAITLIAAAWLRYLYDKQAVPLVALLANGLLYISYIVLILA